MGLSDYRELTVWQRGMRLATDVCRTMSRLPVHERYGLAQQACRSAVSVPSNIAEGWGGYTTPIYRRHARLAHGSLCELQTQLELCRALGYPGDWQSLMETALEVSKLLNGLIRHLNTKK